VEVAILLHEGVSAVEALGPLAVLRRVPTSRVQLVASVTGRVSTQAPVLELTITVPVSAVARPDVLVLPGGLGAPYLVNDATIVDWIGAARATAQWTMATSTGARLLDGDDDRTLTAADGSQAVELALTIAGHVAGLAVADKIRAEVVGGDVGEWHREAVAAAAPPSRWQRLLARARYGSLMVEHDDSRARSLPPQLPKGWRGPAPSTGSAVDE
jgi:putative intracellular protease/amidase